MRSEFERWLGDVWLSDAEWDESKNTYSDSRIHCMWSAWQHQQTKVDELTKQRDSFIKAYEIEVDKSVELQKRVDELELTIKGAVTFVDLQIEATEQGRDAAIGAQAKNWWSSKLLMLRPVRRVLEQALKGGSNE